jgi:hypothetical protein
MRWVEYVVHTREKTDACTALWGNEKESAQQDDLDIDGRIITRWVLEKEVGVTWTGLMWLRIGLRCGFL